MKFRLRTGDPELSTNRQAYTIAASAELPTQKGDSAQFAGI